MGILYAFLASLGQNSSDILNRYNFKRTKIASQQLMFLVFAAMSATMTLVILSTGQPAPHFTPTAIGLLVLIALVSFGGNFFDFRSLKADDLSLREPLTDSQPIIAGLVGYLLFPAERHPGFLLVLLLSIPIVYWGTHRRKLRKFQSKGLLFLLIAVCLYGLLPSIYKLTLEYASPAYITLFRVVSILVLSIVFLPSKKLTNLSSKQLGLGLISGVACSLGVMFELYAIATLGVVVTMLLLLLGPLMRFSASQFILKEKVRGGEVLSSALLALLVLAGVLGLV